MSGGKCPGGTCPGGFCPVTLLVESSHILKNIVGSGQTALNTGVSY